MYKHLFTSDRLGFRNWTSDDVSLLFEINNDDDVMEFFPSKPSLQETKDFIIRMQHQFETKGFCYFAVDHLGTKQCIGFIGLSEQNYLSEPKSFVDIGWRLHKKYWNQGLATEGALACLDFAFHQLELKEIYSVASELNKKSEYIMQKIGMQQIGTFLHPKLIDTSHLHSCVFYKVTKEEYKKNVLSKK